jgi:hypothetical protein
MRLVLTAILFAALACLLSACGGVLYEHRTDVPDLPDKVVSTLATGDTREKVRSMLGEPLVDAPALGLEVYRKSGRDFGVAWIIAPWVPVPAWGDKAVVVIMVLYDEHQAVTEIASTVWEETHYRFGGDSADAGGFSFVNVSSEEPATLLSPQIVSQDVAMMLTNDGRCSVFFVMDRCPMETIHLDGREIADFHWAGQYCEVDDARYQPVNHVLYGTVLWIQTQPGWHSIKVSQRALFGDFEEAFECEAGDAVYAELQGSRLVPDSWYGRRLEGSIHITKSAPETLMSQDVTRFILWHEGSWFGQPEREAMGP